MFCEWKLYAYQLKTHQKSTIILQFGNIYVGSECIPSSRLVSENHNNLYSIALKSITCFKFNYETYCRKKQIYNDLIFITTTKNYKWIFSLHKPTKKDKYVAFWVLNSYFIWNPLKRQTVMFNVASTQKSPLISNIIDTSQNKRLFVYIPFVQ